MTARVLLRGAAVAIALAGLLDPTLTTRRFARVEVQLLATSPVRDSVLIASVIQRLGQDFRVVVGDVGAADATILVGDRPPAQPQRVRGPLIAVVPPRASAWLAVERITRPAQAMLHERVVVGALLHAVGLKGQRLEVALHDGPRVVARTSVTPQSADERLVASLPFVATSAGTIRLRVSVRGRGVAGDAADAMIEVRSGRYDVLAFDLRPSWQATFVRRALDVDARFAVASRMVTSRGVSSARGTAPADLTNPALLDRYGVVLVGSPGQLGAAEVAALERFMRVRGGRVVLLLDQLPTGPVSRLLGGAAWRHDSSGRVVDVVADSSLGRLRGASLAVPGRLPGGAGLIAEAGPGRPVIWSLPVGEGEVVVIGVLDAWQRRGATESDFGRFWPTLVATLAAAVPPPVELSLERSVLGVGDSTEVNVTLSDLAGGEPGGATVEASLIDSAGGRSPVRLWPGLAVGSLRGMVHPGRAGHARVDVRWGNDSASVPMIVDSAALVARPGGEDLLAAWVAGAGGVSLAGDNLARLPDVVHGLIGAPPAPEPWHPMRSPWWILPFACLLATEWWLRRRAGDA